MTRLVVTVEGQGEGAEDLTATLDPRSADYQTQFDISDCIEADQVGIPVLGLYSGVEVPIPEEFYSEKLIDTCFNKYKPLIPLHRWLFKLSNNEFSRL